MTVKEVKEILKKKKYKQILEPQKKLILEMVPFAETFEEALFCINNNIIEMPICHYPECTNKIPHRCYSGLGFYPSGCGEDHTKKLNNLKKYGVENISQLDTVKKKKETTTFKNYGVKNPKQSKAISEKIRNTMLKKYGGFGKQGVLKETIETTCLERFGVTNPMKVTKHRDKLVKTLFTKIVERLANFVKPNFTFEDYIDSSAKQEWECIACSTIFEGKIINGAIPRCPICFPNQKRSYGEMDLFNLIDTSDKIQGDWSILKNQEIDIFIPSKKIAIEFNGIYWHSELNGKDENYHLNKTLKCEEQGIQLIHIFETEWKYKQEIVLSVINASLENFKNIINASECQIKKLNLKEKNQFLEENHVQGQDVSSIGLGLLHNEEIVNIVTFSKLDTPYNFEVCRFCSKLGFKIIGGETKLFNYFVKKYNPKSIIAYDDRRYSNCKLYEKLGFTKIGVTSPKFFNIKKSKLEKSTDLKNIENNDRIWDCGSNKFEWINKNP